MNKVGIIIPVWKVDIKLLHRCIKSILASTYSDFTIYVIDDGNTIKYASQLDELRKWDSRIQVHHFSHGGLCSARNHGMNISNNEYLSFVDSDDIITDFFLDQSVQILENDLEIDIVCGGVIYEDATNSGYKVTYTTAADRCYSGKEIEDIVSYVICNKSKNKKLELENYPLGSASWKLYRRSSLKNLRFDESIKLYEDRLFNAVAFDNARKISIVKDVWYTYYQYPTSLIHRYNSGFALEFPNLVKAYQNIRNDIYNDSVCKWYISMLTTCFYLDIINVHNKDKFFEKLKLVRKILKSDEWVMAKSNFSYHLIEPHNKVIAFLATHEMSSLLLFYYILTFKIKNIKKK